ncbi:hypothetical protein BGZ47_008018 [Haplosporangium gracile]|nr:hypothetical protein BGZ47_008018 [Haplosporangium gracile]
MADCIVNLSEESPATTLGTLTPPVEGSPPLPSAGLPSPSTLAISEPTPSPKAHRWYLREAEEGSSSTEQSLTLDEEHQAPVKINASKKTTTWHVPLPSDHEMGAFYDIVLGVSTQNLKIDSIEAILVRFDQLQLIEGSFEFEVIPSHELKRLSSLDSLDMGNDKDLKVLRWKLFHLCYGYENGVTISVEFSTWSKLSFDYGFLDLHFVELCTDSLTLYKADPLYREHRPHAAWLIDVNRSECSEYGAITKMLKVATNYSFSGDGRFAALKVVVGESKYLEVWDLQDHDTATKETRIVKNKGGMSDGGITGGDKKTMLKPYSAAPIVWLLLPNGDTDISISWDGSLVAVVDKKEDPPTTYQSMFTIYQCSRDNNQISEKSFSRMSLVRQDVQRTCSELRNYIGDGIFHMVNKANPNLKEELFVTYNGISIDIYNTFEDWTFQRSIAMDMIVTSLGQAPAIGYIFLNRLRGRYLIIGNGRVYFTFDIVLGTLVSFSSVLSFDRLYFMNYHFCSVSENGSLIAIPEFRGLNIYRTETWTLHGSYVFHEIPSDERVTSVSFLCNDSILAVCVESIDNAFLQTRPGYLLDVARMSLVDRIAPDGCDYPRLVPLNGSIQGLAYVGHTKLWHMRLEDRAYHSNPISPTRCTDLCQNSNSQENEYHNDNNSGTNAFGLHFKAETTETYIKSSHLKREKRSSLTVTMTNTTGAQAKMVVPLPDGVSIRSINFFAAYQYLLVRTSDALMAWSVPKSFEGDFRLQMVLCAPDFCEWKICPHGYVRCEYYEVDAFNFLNHITHPISEIVTISFLSGLESALKIYELAELGVKQDILRYYAGHLNYYPLQEDLASTLLVKAVNLWSASDHYLLCDFLKSLLSSSTARWVPLQDMPISINPVDILLNFASKNSLAIGLLEIIIDYCLSKAKVEQDPHFLLPIRQCIVRIVDPKQQYSELALKIYREVAFFPAQGPEFVIGHHALANPANFRWAFWRPPPWGLYQYKDQVLQLDLHGAPNPPKGNFTRDIYQASFDLLWRKTEVKKSQQDSSQRAKDDLVHALFSWPQAIWTMILRKCRLKTNATVKCYPFELKALDNPALKALVEYKWNTIGFDYWLVRFLGQVVYYVMVLTAIFLQIYGNQDGLEAKNGRIDHGLEGLFVAIIVVSFIFLWLEFVQLLKDKRSYFRTIYNWVDLIVFLLPLAGAINQILIIQGVIISGLNPGLLSFSVLFIFLHLLFELRVFEVVCHFVSIIIRAIHSIRVFIFVFAGGLLAFSIAIVHLLFTCVDIDHCKYFTEGFSRNLLRALSVTYFMMGGNYDQVETGFTSNSFAFHGMMMVFFFFTVIVMLNVLIALINNAITDSDQTWRQNWLECRMRYVESAENMSYDIPGFREKHKCFFPDTIYYTGTPQQVREYQKKTRQLLEETASSALSPEGETKHVSEFSSVTAVVAIEKLAVVQKGPQDQDSKGTTMARLTAIELQKQLDAERVNSEKQIGELQQQLRGQQETLKEQQQMLVQILSKLDR